MRSPSSWVERFIAGAPGGGRVLDVACGAGRHVALARRHGLEVTGIDRDLAAARLAFAGDEGVTLVEHDLEDRGSFPFAPASFDGVIVTNYLWRPILSDIVAAVATHGVLIYETFRVGNEQLGRPTDPAFLLRPGELLEAVAGRLNVVAFEEALRTGPDRAVQRLCAVGSLHHWNDMPPSTG